jgi:hypothetical protein
MTDQEKEETSKNDPDALVNVSNTTNIEWLTRSLARMERTQNTILKELRLIKNENDKRFVKLEIKSAVYGLVLFFLLYMTVGAAGLKAIPVIFGS